LRHAAKTGKREFYNKLELPDSVQSKFLQACFL